MRDRRLSSLESPDSQRGAPTNRGKPQATYLLWLDCRALGLDDMTLRDFMRQKARVGLDDGFLFGAGGSGFQRMNIACPRGILEEALRRIEIAVNLL